MLVFKFSFIFCSSVELPKIKIEFPCVEDLFINVYVAHSKAQSIQANGMTYALFFFRAACGWADHSYTNISNVKKSCRKLWLNIGSLGMQF